MTDKLLPCPFCGGKVQPTEEPRMHIHWVYCQHCGAASAYYETEAEAIAAWNTRTERTCRREPCDGVLGICSECYASLPEYLGWSYCPRCGAKVVER